MFRWDASQSFKRNQKAYPITLMTLFCDLHHCHATPLSVILEYGIPNSWELDAEGKVKAMKVKELMTATPYYCQPETNLGTATELMWKGNCGFLPVVGNDGKVFGVVTDRDICIALGTRNRLPGDIKVSEVITSQKLFYCCPDDDVHVALQAIQTGRVRRLPVITHDGVLAGIVSMDDILLKAEPMAVGKQPELSSDEIVRTYRAITQPQLMAKSAAA
jgi:CBS domain-containing protein